MRRAQALGGSSPSSSAFCHNTLRPRSRFERGRFYCVVRGKRGVVVGGPILYIVKYLLNPRRSRASQEEPMQFLNSRTDLRSPALLWAVALGILADALVRVSGRPGLNVALWALAGVAVLFV